MATVWVTEVHFETDKPVVRQYECTRLDPGGTSVTVLVRGYKQVIRKTDGRRFFTDEREVAAYCRRYMEQRSASLQSRAKQLLNDLKSNLFNIEIVPSVQPRSPGKLIL